MKRLILLAGIAAMCLMPAMNTYAYLESYGGGAIANSGKCSNTLESGTNEIGTVVIKDKSLSDSLIYGTGAKVNFPTTQCLTQTYDLSADWQALSSTYADSARIPNSVQIETHVAQGLGAYAACTITSAVLDRGDGDDTTPYYCVISITDSTSAGMETIVYSRQTGGTNPPDGEWVTYTSGTIMNTSARYVRWRAYMTTGDSATFSPILQYVNMTSKAWYDVGMKIYGVHISSDNSTDSSYMDIDEGADEHCEYRCDTKSRTPFCPEFPAPLDCDDTVTVYVASGMHVKIWYLLK